MGALLRLSVSSGTSQDYQNPSRPKPGHPQVPIYIFPMSEESVRGLNECVYRPLGIRTTFRSRGTIREALAWTKEPPTWKKKGVMYQVPCAECNCAYIGETGRMLEKRLSEHRGVVKRDDTVQDLWFQTYCWR